MALSFIVPTLCVKAIKFWSKTASAVLNAIAEAIALHVFPNAGRGLQPRSKRLEASITSKRE